MCRLFWLIINIQMSAFTKPASGRSEHGEHPPRDDVMTMDWTVERLD
jgi:hypothetical protein